MFEIPKLTSKNNSPTELRIGVAVNGERLPLWIAQILHDIVASAHLDLALVIQVDNSSGGFLAALRRVLRAALFRAWRWWDYRHFAQPIADSTLDAKLSIETNPTIPRTLLHIVRGRIVQPNERAMLEAAKLDVILQLAPVVLAHELADASQSVVWHFEDEAEDGDNPETKDDGARLFTLMAEGATEFTTVLEALDPGAHHNRILSTAVSRLNPISLYRNENPANCLKAEMLIRELSSVGRKTETGSSIDSRPRTATRRPTGNLSTTRFLMRWFQTALRDRLQDRFCLDRWVIAFRKNHSSLRPDSHMRGFHVIVPPLDCFYADPFVWSRNNRTYILFEDFSFGTRKGVIACVEVDETGNHSAPVVVLEKDHHLSYPFVFQWDGEIFLVPESVAAGCIELYRAVEFPYRWSFEKVLIDNILAVDSTLVKYNGRWWLFASGVSRRFGAFNQDLHLFSSDSPLGQWRPHPQNPIVSDVRRARPAGHLFAVDGKLMRPGQNCAKTYGHATVFNQVETLTDDEYRELPVHSIVPGWLPRQLGVHTFNQNTTFQVVDARVLLPRLGTRSVLSSDFELQNVVWMGAPITRQAA